MNKSLLIAAFLLFKSLLLFQVAMGQSLSSRNGWPPSAFLFVTTSKNADTSIFKESPGLTVYRRLNDTSYIIKASENWLATHRSSLRSLTSANDVWKMLALGTPKKTGVPDTSGDLFYIKVSSPDSLIRFAALNHQEVEIVTYKNGSGIFKIRTKRQFLLSVILPLGYVTCISQVHLDPRVESPVSDFNDAVNEINVIHNVFPELQGIGLVASVKEDGFDTTDMDLRGRTIPAGDMSGLVTTHATDMATLIGGAGNSFYSGLGCAKSSKLISTGFSDLMPDDADYGKFGITVQNHSYGVNIENFYGMEAYAYDQSAIDLGKVLNIFSAGNIGDSTPADGIYTGIAGFANLTGNFKMAKNILTVGSIGELKDLLPLSSKGPAYDGRVKPELVAYGSAGSSEAAALVSGVALLIQNAYMKKYGDTLPGNMLVKAVLINSADDVGPKGIDFYSGYGNVNAYKAIENIRNGQFLSGSVWPEEEKEYPVNIPANASNCKVTLVWADPPAQPGSYRALRNDLDLSLRNVQTGEEWKPWVLQTLPNADSLNALPTRGRDSINPVEQVTLEMPSAGQYLIKVTANSLTTLSQDFNIAYQFDTLNSFRWSFPYHNDNMVSGSINTFRWDNQYNTQKGVLEYSIDKGNTWNNISQDIGPGQTFIQWTAPDTNVMAMARMTFGNSTYYTDSFPISRPVRLAVGFDCTDSVLLYWPKVKGIDAFSVYSILDNHLQPILSVTDTFAIIRRDDRQQPYFAVAPELGVDENGFRSYTINDADQGVSCYISNFLADIQPGDSSVVATLSLGTIFNVRNIYFEKSLNSDSWQSIHVQSPGSLNDLTYAYTDMDGASRDGVIWYRVKIELQSGGFIYTDALPVYLIRNAGFLVFPNVRHRSESFQVLSRNTLNTDYFATIYDMSGRIRYSGRLYNRLETVRPANLEAGVYLFVIRDRKEQVCRAKIIYQ